MFTIRVETNFRASHRITTPDGSKEPLHYHNWTVAAVVGSEQLGGEQLVMDFGRLKKLLDEIIAEFDNSDLGKRKIFQKNNPSAEIMAEYVYDILEPQLPENVKMVSIEITEQPGCIAKYTK